MIRPTFLGFETAKKGLTAAQKGLDVTGQNLTNWDSAGYTRQRITQVAVAPDSYRNRYSSSRVGPAGQGVDITGVGQIRDVYLDKRYRDECAEQGYYTRSSEILGDIQAALNEFNPNSDTGLRSVLMALSDALQSFSVHAYSETHANIVTSAMKNVTQTLQQISGKLESAREQQIYDLSVSVDDVNKKLMELAGLNKTIMDDAASFQSNPYFGPNELYDQRNLLLDELSQYADITYSTNEDGTVDVVVNGQLAVSGSKYDKIEMTRDERTDVVGLRWVSTNQPVEMLQGSLKASTDYINGRGPNIRNPGESIQRGALYYKDQLNAFAQSLANTLNNIVPEYDPETGKPKQAVDENGNPMVDASGNPVLVYKQLLGGLSTVMGEDGKYHVEDDIPITADNLSISDAWANNSGYIIYQRNPDENDTSDNVGNYALALADAVSNATIYFDANGEEFNGTFLDFVKNYVTTLGEDVSFAENRLEATNVIVQNLEDSRDSVSGVVVDEEVANMMLYNKSLSAASRLMTAMDEALDVIINKTGLVGR